jgi:hypothetical protein
MHGWYQKMNEKVELKEKLQAVDQNIKELWDAMDEPNQKLLKSEFFILNRYISNVKHRSRDVQEHYVLTVNEYYNKHWNTLQKHPKLLWMLLCMCSYDGETTFYHEWISNKKKARGNKKVVLLEELYPHYKSDEIDVLASMYSDKELTQLARDMGMDESEIKKLK